jgi:hypothetical protein
VKGRSRNKAYKIGAGWSYLPNGIHLHGRTFDAFILRDVTHTFRSAMLLGRILVMVKNERHLEHPGLMLHSIRGLATYCNCSQTTIHRWLNGQNCPRGALKARVVGYLLRK